jgi:hypothetical protein
MDAADPAGREDADAGRRRGDHRCRDGRGRPAVGRERRRQVRPGGLHDRAGGRLRERFEVGLAKPDVDPAGADRDRRGRRPGLDHRGLGRAGDLEILGIRQAVADQRRLEGDDRPAVAKSGRDAGSIERRSANTA